MKFISHNEKETEEFASRFASSLKKGDAVAFFGDLGAGKTTFVRGAAKVLAPESYVQSPTFTVMIAYDGKVPLYHFDMYRIHSYEELYGIGFFDYVESDGITFIEWSENIESMLPQNCIRVNICKLSDSEREIEITGGRAF